MRSHHPHAVEPLKLSDAQLVIARELGFPGWPRLKAYVERLAAHGPGLQHAYRENLDYYEERADGLLASAQDGTDGAVAAFARHDAPLTRAGARIVVAREHGLGTWAALRRHVAGLRDAGEPFTRAYRAVEAQDVDGLAELVDRFPELVAARGTNGNDLIGMAGATCDERLVAVLLERGADVNSANAHGWTPLHQAAYSDLPLLARMLLDAGARVDVSARGDGGTPLVVALFWGNRATARRADTPRRSGGSSRSAPIRTSARRSAVPATASARRRSTSPRRTESSTRSGRCWTWAPIRPCGTGSTTARPPAGPSTAAGPPRATCSASTEADAGERAAQAAAATRTSRQAAANASTTTGSNCVPAQRRSSSSAVLGRCARRSTAAGSSSRRTRRRPR